MTRGAVVAAGGAPWEAQVLDEIERSDGLRLVRRCLDVAEVLSLSELCDVAVVSTDLAHLSADAVMTLERDGVQVIGIGAEASGRRIGIRTIVEPGALHSAVASAPSASASELPAGRPAQVVAVWGPHGAPGRSVVAASVATLLSGGVGRVCLVDADPRGGSLAQMFALLDDVSGLVAACRSADRGRAADIMSHAVSVAPGLRVITGVPRAEMWSQVRRGPFELVLQHLMSTCSAVVVDTGPALDDHTKLILDRATDVIVVGRADPVGLARLVRALHDLRDVRPRPPDVVTVNQLRATSSWSARDIEGALVRLAGISPDVIIDADYRALDIAAIRGVSPVEAAPSSPFAEGVSRIVGQLQPAEVAAPV